MFPCEDKKQWSPLPARGKTECAVHYQTLPNNVHIKRQCSCFPVKPNVCPGQGRDPLASSSALQFYLYHSIIVFLGDSSFSQGNNGQCL